MVIQKIVSFALALALAGPGVLSPHTEVPDMAPDFDPHAKGAVVMEYQSGRVLYAHNAQVQRPMASTTKILTALITLEQPDQDVYFTVDPVAVHVEGSSMGLREGDQVTLGALAYGMLLPSGNDGANVAAVRIGGTIPDFIEMMNDRAQAIGMEDSSFASPSGLDAQGHYSTAYDMALLAREALQNPDFREICSSYKAVQEYGNPPYKRWLTNHNKLLQLYEGTIGVKTGFTDSAGRCLVTACERDGVTLIVVTLGASDDFNTHMKLYDRYFARLQATDVRPLLEGITFPVAGLDAQVPVAVAGPDTAALAEGEREQLTREICGHHFAYAPVKQGDLLGTVRLRCGDQVVYEGPLVAAEGVEAPAPRGLFSALGRLLGGLMG